MRQYFKILTLTVIMLAGIVADTFGKTLTYDFMTNHPATTIRIDQGYKVERDGKVYWGGAWGGLFGNKIAFDPASAYPSLRAQGGLCDYHDHQKMYLMNLSAGDKFTIYYSGQNASMQYHVSSTCMVSGLVANFDSIHTDRQYTVTQAGNLCMINKYKSGEAETIISKIVIETANNLESTSISNGICTYYSKNPLDLSANTDLKAYVATGFEDGKFIFKQVDYVPAQTGFLIVAQSGTVTNARMDIGISPNYMDNYIDNNLFKGTFTNLYVNVPSGMAGYIFAVASGKVGIYKMGDGFVCNPNKAYLLVDE